MKTRKMKLQFFFSFFFVEETDSDVLSYVLIIIIVTLPLLESCLNWVAGPMPPPTRHLADLTSPPASSENTPPADSSRKLPRRLRPRRRRGKQSASSANENSASRVADPATPLGHQPMKIRLPVQ